MRFPLRPQQAIWIGVKVTPAIVMACRHFDHRQFFLHEKIRRARRQSGHYQPERQSLQC
ncbi:MAG: hypothetical protein LBS89_00880 [Zoogloeaceae bacterium]|jgi:hypothetical protein|nr:hypothetical protein [Zoogloeaceae bacterium]